MTKQDTGAADFFTGVGGLLLAVVILLFTSEIGEGAGYVVVSPKFFPAATAIGILTVSALLVRSGGASLLRQRRAVVESEGTLRILPPGAEDEERGEFQPAIVLLGALFVYAILLPLLGFILAGALLAAGVTIYLSKANWVWVVVGSLVGVGAIYYVFTELLYVNLPAGPLVALFG